LLIGKDDGLPWRQRIRHAKYASVIENDDGPALFPCRTGSAGGIAGQTSNKDGNLEANRIRSRGLICSIFRDLAG
jgi:hypothetical protein